MITYYIILFFYIFILPDNSAIKKVQNEFIKLKSLQADFIQISNNKISLKGKFFFNKENHYRIELQNNTIITDGTTIWNYDKKRNRIVVSNMDNDPLAFSLKEYIFNYPAVCKITEEKTIEGKVIITLKPQKENLNFKEVKLWLTNNFLVNKIEVKDYNGSSFAFKFNNIKIDNNINPGLFKPNKNSDAKIIDLR